ncbi:MAG: hypothetical protein NVSMB38_17680 [Ktedonobacteraceae bacterium]
MVRRGHGKTAQDQRLRTELVGGEALTSYDQYGDAEDTQNAHRRDYVGQADQCRGGPQMGESRAENGGHSLFDHWGGEQSFLHIRHL